MAGALWTPRSMSVAGVDPDDVAGRRDGDAVRCPKIRGERIVDQQPGVVQGGVLGVVLLALILHVGDGVGGRRGSVEHGEPIAQVLAVRDERALQARRGAARRETMLISSTVVREKRPVRSTGSMLSRPSYTASLRVARESSPPYQRTAGGAQGAERPLGSRSTKVQVRRARPPTGSGRGSGCSCSRLRAAGHQAERAVDVADDARRVAAVTRVERKISKHLAVRDQLVARGARGVRLMQQDDGDAELARSDSEPCSGADRRGLCALLGGAQSRCAERDRGVGLAIDGLHLDRIADHGVVGEGIQQLQYGACLDAAGRIETDVEGIDYDGEASTRHGPRPLIFDRNAQTVAPCAGVERLHVEERISFHEREPSGCATIEGTIELHLGGRRRGRCIRRQPVEEDVAAPAVTRTMALAPKPVPSDTSSRVEPGEAVTTSGVGWIGVIAAAFWLRTFVPAGCARTSGLSKSGVAGIGTRCGAVRSARDADVLVIRRIADTKDVTHGEAHAIEQVQDDRPGGAAAASVFTLKSGTTDRLGYGRWRTRL